MTPEFIQGYVDGLVERRRQDQASRKSEKREYDKLWKRRNPEQYAAAKKRHYEKHRERLSANSKSRYKLNPDKYISDDIFRKYGITLQQKEDMLAAQGGVCAGNGCATPGNKKGWHVDHDHNTGRIRGILCHHCNATLGNAKDDPKRLRALADYAERHQCQI